jgi:hypothetical protein
VDLEVVGGDDFKAVASGGSAWSVSEGAWDRFVSVDAVSVVDVASGASDGELFVVDVFDVDGRKR